MSAIKTVAWSAAASVLLGMGTVHADPIARSKAGWPWTLYWPAAAANSRPVMPAAAAPAAAPTITAGPASAPVPDGASNPVSPVFAATPMPVAEPAAPTNAAFSPMIASAPASSPTPASPTSAAPADAFINMTASTYPDAGGLTTGTPEPWYDSPAVIQAFGGSIPTAQQQASFVETVLQDVEHTYQLSGMNPTLTTDPTAPALHTISVASGLSDPNNSNAIGLTNVGQNGFSFIDKLNYANNPTDLAWAVAHNIAHELMHAFGVGFHPDQGTYVDAPSATWSTLIDPNAQIGPAATQLLLASQYGALGSSSVSGIGAQALNPSDVKVDGDMELLAVPAPEPAAVAMWILGGFGGLSLVRRRSRRPA